MSDRQDQTPNQPQMQPQEPIKIPVDTPPPSPRGEYAPDVDRLVREYEAKYKGMRDGEPDIVAESLKDSDPIGDLFQKAKRKNAPLPRTGITTEQERLWAAVAHFSALVTLLVGVPTAGFGLLLTLLIPLMIFLYYREKSQFVAFHALQALALQVIGTFGFVAILAAGWLIAGIVMIVFAITIILLPVDIFIVLAMILFTIATFALPLSMVVFGVIGALEALQGKWYKVPYIGEWLEQQTNGGILRNI